MSVSSGGMWEGVGKGLNGFHHQTMLIVGGVSLAGNGRDVLTAPEALKKRIWLGVSGVWIK